MNKELSSQQIVYGSRRQYVERAQRGLTMPTIPMADLDAAAAPGGSPRAMVRSTTQPKCLSRTELRAATTVTAASAAGSRSSGRAPAVAGAAAALPKKATHDRSLKQNPI